MITNLTWMRNKACMIKLNNMSAICLAIFFSNWDLPLWVESAMSWHQRAFTTRVKAKTGNLQSALKVYERIGFIQYHKEVKRWEPIIKPKSE